jgi:pimeloyl-ACP methyl ester carboxylesterase
MPYAESAEAKLYFEETGSGYPVLFVHEFGGDYRSWNNQVSAFSRHYRCITFNARGYPPSDVPESDSAYGYEHAADDITAVMRHLNIERAHIVGLSMGGYAALVFGLRYPGMASALVVAGCGSGSDPSTREAYLRDIPARADRLFTEGIALKLSEASVDPTRTQLRAKDPKGWDEFLDYLKDHSVIGSSLTLRNVQGKRPALHELEADLKKLAVPVLLITGDEDEHCLQPNLYLKRMIASSGLWVVPNTGHAVNLEEAVAFNQVVLDFFGSVERGSWQHAEQRKAPIGK